MVPVPEDGERATCAAADGEVAETSHTGAQIVQLLEDDGEGLEGHVEDGVDEGKVGTGRRHNWLGDEHANGPGTYHRDELGGVGALEVAGRDDGRGGAGGVWVGGCFFAEARGPAGKEDGTECFGEE